MAKRFPLLLGCLLLLWNTQSFCELAIIVHPDNPQNELSQKQLQRIFLGRMPLFPQTEKEITALDLPDDHPAFIEFYRRVVEMEGTQLKRYRAYYLFSGRGKLPVKKTSAQEVLKAVSENQWAIGYINSSSVNDSVRVLLEIKTQPSSESAP